MKKVYGHFKKSDPLLYSYLLKIEKLQKIQKDKSENYFFRLCKEIINQQLSDKAGSAIFNRFVNLFPDLPIIPANILSLPHEQLRNTGMSHAKARYVRNLAEAVTNNSLNFNNFDSLPNEEVITKLTKVKGIGQWTAEMFLMFVLGREDVFSHGDLGLKKGLMKIYKLPAKFKKEDVEKIISKWSPYKTYASRILWASLEL